MNKTFLAPIITLCLLTSAAVSARPVVCAEFDRAMNQDEPSRGEEFDRIGYVPESRFSYATWFATNLSLPGAQTCILTHLADNQEDEVFCDAPRLKCSYQNDWLDILAVTLELCYPNAAVTYRLNEREDGSSERLISFSLSETPSREIKLEQYCGTIGGKGMMTYTVDFQRRGVDLPPVPPMRL